MKRIEDIQGLQNCLAEADKIWIYGAGAVGRLLLSVAAGSGVKRKIKGFLVSDKAVNPDEIEGVPVRSFESSVFVNRKLGQTLIEN